MTERDAIERALGGALRPDAAPKPGDSDLLERLIVGAVQAPPAPIVKPSFMRLGVLGGVGVAGVAALLLMSRSHPAAPAAAAPVVTPESVTARQPPPVAELVAAPATPSSALPSSRATAQPQARPLSAVELFARANDERRKGRDGDAIDDYRSLQRDFGTSPEAMASHVTLGRLLLDKRSDASGALAQFDLYLAGSAKGTLQEEALIGRALSLDRLGRPSDARRAWQALLDQYPDSVYADQARTRVGELGR